MPALTTTAASSDLSDAPTIGDYVTDVLVPVLVAVYIVALITMVLCIRSTYPVRRNIGVTAAGAALVLNVMINVMFIHDSHLTGILAVVGVTHLALAYMLHQTAPLVRQISESRSPSDGPTDAHNPWSR